MRITVKNEFLTLEVDPIGAQLRRILTKTGKEILWRGNEAYWGDSAPLLFPFIARLYGECHRVKEKTYPMTIHGFANSTLMAVAEKGEDYILLRARESEKTLLVYPFPFELEIGYRLNARAIEITYRVHNTGTETMSFGIGGHPGFNVPLEEGLAFEDYELAFSKPCKPMRIGFDEAILLSGHDMPYPLQEDCHLPLRHDLFDDDAIILAHAARAVTLRAAKGSVSVTVSFPQMPYLGIWHKPHSDAPYVCIEPWSSLPGRSGVVEDFSCRSDLIHLPAGESYGNTWTIQVDEG